MAVSLRRDSYYAREAAGRVDRTKERVASD